MPTYQYACKACDHRFEAVQPFSDSALTECPQCAGLLRKVFSSVGIVFKGSGFYRTDSRAGAVAGGESGGGKESSSSNGDAGSKTGSTSADAGKSSSDKAAAGTSGNGKTSTAGSGSSSTPAAAAAS